MSDSEGKPRGQEARISGRVVLGVGIAALLGAAIFGAGFWFARRGILGGPVPVEGLRVFHPGIQGESAEGWRGMPFRFDREGGIGPHAGIEAGPMGHMGPGFPGSFEPLTAAEARQAVEAFIGSLGQGGLRVGEVIVFENHAYAVVEKADTGSGAFEVLVDPQSRAAHLEFGPAMMWNTEFGMGAMTSGMGMAGHMPGLSQTDPSVPPSVTAEHAAQIAQAFLTDTHAGAQLGEVISFPGYYTIHYEMDGSFAGMFSVNAYSGQVWDHLWHGAWVESDE